MITGGATGSSKRRNENAQVQKDLWEEMNKDNSNNGNNQNDTFRRAKQQELHHRRIIQSSFPSPAGHIHKFGSTDGVGLPTAATIPVNKNPFAYVSLTAPAIPSSATNDINNEQLKSALKILKSSEDLLISITHDPYAPVFFSSTHFKGDNMENKIASSADISSTNIAGASTVSKPKSAITLAATAVKASPSLTGFTFKVPTSVDDISMNPTDQKTKKQSIPFSSSSSGNIGFSFFPTSGNTPIKETGTVTSKVKEEVVEEEGEFEKEEPELALKECNEDEDTLYEIRVKHYKFLPTNEWKSFGTGILRLMQSKADPLKHRRMVLRNEVIGSVLLNVGIGKGMTFYMEPQAKDDSGFIRFANPADGGKHMFKVKGIVNLEKLHSMLNNLAK